MTDEAQPVSPLPLLSPRAASRLTVFDLLGPLRPQVGPEHPHWETQRKAEAALKVLAAGGRLGPKD